MFWGKKSRLAYDTTYYSEIVADKFIKKQGGQMQMAIDNLHQSFTTSENIQMDITEGSEDAHEFAQELFGTLVDGAGATQVSNPTPWAKECFDMLEEHSDWNKLQRLCRYKQELSALTTAGMINDLCEHLGKIREQHKQQEQEGGGEQQGQGGGQEQQPTQSSGEAREQAQQAIEKVMDKAVRSAEKAEGAYGSLAGTAFGKNETDGVAMQKKQELIHQMCKNSHFKTMVDLIGRMQITTKAKIAKIDEKQVLLADIEYGNDITRLTKMELMNAVMPETEVLFLKRYAERKLQQRKASGTSKVGKGDMIIMLDESGSMGGTPATLAKAFSIAMVEMAIQEGRKAIVMGFTGGVNYIWSFSKKSCQVKHSSRWHKVPQAEGVSYILGHRTGGGTSFGRVMGAALELLSENKNADLVMVSDACDGMPARHVDELNRLKKSMGVRTMAVFISDYPEYVRGQHEHWADTVTITPTDPESLIENLTNMAVEAIK
jgi:uncharacterized protein with von Willebrand factor type A (vWA) domain